MKVVIIFLNLGALILSTIWYIQSGYQFEPLILNITLVATLLGLFFNEFTKRSKVKIKGSENTAYQGNSNGSKSADIIGNSNNVNQE